MIKLFNSLTGRKDDFTPIAPPRVRMYSCGPTVYGRVHIGNLRSFITADILARTLREVGQYDVQWVMNITDIDDKMIANMHEQYSDEEPQTALHKLANKYITSFKQDLATVNVNRDGRDISFIRATDNIALMQDLIRRLQRDGLAYESHGSIYFDLRQYQAAGHRYGRLINIHYEPQARVTDDQDQKEGVADFALWKAKKDGEPFWDFDFEGQNLPGRPGWHIECTAMSVKELGQPFDIHTGGTDLKFPHHENEIAQAEGELAHWFVHNEFLKIDGQEMHKSLHNFVTLDDIDSPLAFRLRVLQAHYRHQLDFSHDNLEQARNLLNKLRGLAARLEAQPELPPADTKTTELASAFDAAMADDLNTPAALTTLSATEDLALDRGLLELLQRVDTVLGLELFEHNDWSTEEQALIHKRETARKQKDYKSSDELRLRLESERILSEDTKSGGVYWRRV